MGIFLLSLITFLSFLLCERIGANISPSKVSFNPSDDEDRFQYVFSHLRSLQSPPADIQVNQFVTGDQNDAAVASLKYGGFVIVWQSNGQIGAGLEIMARMYYPNGTAINNEFIVNTITAGAQQNPSVIGTEDGGFAVVWEGNDGTISVGFDIFCRMFYRNGTAKGIEFKANGIVINDQKDPYIASLKDGRLVIVWDTSDSSATNLDVRARLFSPTGNPLGDEFTVNSFLPNNQVPQGICSLAFGGFIIIWKSSNQINNWDGYGGLYKEDGTVLIPEFGLNSIVTNNDQSNFGVACLHDGGFVVVWHSQQGTPKEILGRIFNYDGSERVADFILNAHTSNSQEFPTVAPLDQGGFVAAWQSNGQDGSNQGVFSRTFDNMGVPISPTEFQVNSYINADQMKPAIASVDAGFVIAWESDNQDSSVKGVFFRKYTSHLAQLCSTDNHCLGTNFTKCYTPNNICVKCTDSLSCATGHCSPDFFQCYSCSSNDDCTSFNAPFCNTTTGSCQNCLYYGGLQGSTCSNSTTSRCDFVDFTCKACQIDNDCIHIPNRPHCNTTVGACSNCSILEGSLGSTCSDPLNSKCDPVDLTCKPCTADEDCSHISDMPFCNTTSGKCQSCLFYGGSLGSSCTQLSNPKCDTLDYTCKGCTNDNDCNQFPETPLCNTTSGTCQSCLRYMQGSTCPNLTQANCDPITFTCTACTIDADCPSAHPYCITANGTCHQCPQGVCFPCGTNYIYNNKCYSSCPSGTFIVSSLECDTCLTNSNASNCVSCQQDNDCNQLPLGTVFCLSQKCTTIAVEFVNPSQVIESDAQNTILVTVRGDPGYTLSFAIDPNYISYQVISSGILIGPLSIPQSQIPSELKIIVTAISVHGETVQSSILLTVDHPIQYTPIQKATATAVAGAMFVSGVDPALIWSFVNLMQLFYYLLFLNVNYPNSLRRFLGLFSIGRLNFMPNPLAGVASELENEVLPSPPRFFDNGFTGLFIETSGSILSMILASILIDIAAHVLKCLVKNKKLLDSVINFYEWSGLLRMWLSSYLELMFATLLQLFVFYVESIFYAFSSCCAVLVLLANLGLPIWSFWILKNTQKTRKNIGKYQALTEDYDLNHPVKKYFIVFVILRRLLQGALIVLLYYIPLLQVTMVWLVIFVQLILLLVFMPHHKQKMNFLDIIVEMAFVIIHSLIIPIGYNDYTSFLSVETKEIIGWVIIGWCLFVIGIQLILIVKEQYEAFCNLYQKSKEVINYIKNKRKQKQALTVKPVKRSRMLAPEHLKKSVHIKRRIQLAPEN